MIGIALIVDSVVRGKKLAFRYPPPPAPAPQAREGGARGRQAARFRGATNCPWNNCVE